MSFASGEHQATDTAKKVGRPSYQEIPPFPPIKSRSPSPCQGTVVAAPRAAAERAGARAPGGPPWRAREACRGIARRNSRQTRSP